MALQKNQKINCFFEQETVATDVIKYIIPGKRTIYITAMGYVGTEWWAPGSERVGIQSFIVDSRGREIIDLIGNQYGKLLKQIDLNQSIGDQKRELDRLDEQIKLRKQALTKELDKLRSTRKEQSAANNELHNSRAKIEAATRMSQLLLEMQSCAETLNGS